MTLAALSFWSTSGWHLLDRNKDGLLLPTADFMAAYFHRPELALVEESCDAERALHEKLTADPFALVDDSELTAMADPDIIENYRAVLAFREFLGQHNSLEAAYMAIAGGAEISFPPMFVDQICHVILRQILDGEIDAMKLRAAEILFRTQSVTIIDGRIMVADQTTVQFQSDVSRLEGSDTNNDNAQIDVLTSETADFYWERSEFFDTALNIAYDQPGAAALARVLEEWVGHFLKLKVTVTPLQSIENEDWQWHIGLDSDSSTILDDLYHQKDIPEIRLQQILCLFRLETEGGFIERMDGKPVYLALSQNPVGIINAKPQNLLANLPLQGN
jgi:hypothetical protein